MAREVNCVFFGRTMEGLAAPPYPGELGRKIYESISKEAWQTWLQQQTRIINETRMALADPEARKFLAQQMEEFLFNQQH